jgi:hypothetical protein
VKQIKTVTKVTPMDQFSKPSRRKILIRWSVKSETKSVSSVSSSTATKPSLVVAETAGKIVRIVWWRAAA